MEARNSIAKISLFAALLLVVASSIAYGSDAENLQYKWALSFSIEQNLMLYPHEGEGISISRILNERSSIRASEFFNVRAYNTDNYDVRSTTSIVYLRFVGPERRARFYWGTGPWFHYAYNNRSRVSRTIQIGVTGIMGIEVLATEYLRFHAEYRANASYISNKASDIWTDFYYFNAGNSAVFGLSIYF